MIKNSLKVAFLVINIGFLLGGCATIQLISKYDDQTDREATQIQKDFAQFQVDLDTAVDPNDLSFGRNQDFYKREMVAIQTLENRVSVIPKNGITTNEVKLLKVNFGWLAMLHKGCMNGSIRDENRTIMESSGPDVSIACRKDYGADQDLPNQSAHRIVPDVARNAINSINTGLNAIITLEVAKKRGETK
jgi:hypothetical protein